MEAPTEQDLVLALQELLKQSDRPDGSLTTTEMMDKLNGQGIMISYKGLRKRLKELKENEVIEVCQIPIKDLADKNQLIPGYRLVRKSNDEIKH